MKRNLVGKTLGKIKIFVQDFVPIRTALILRKYIFFVLIEKSRSKNAVFRFRSAFSISHKIGPKQENSFQNFKKKARGNPSKVSKIGNKFFKL